MWDYCECNAVRTRMGRTCDLRIFKYNIASGKIYANEGVAQFIFLESDEVCETSYKDRAGKYQGQKGVTLPKPSFDRTYH